MADLEITGGERTGERFELEKPLTIGRENADLTLADSEVSRRHAVLRPGDTGEIVIEDLGSLNGTWVNGERLTTARTVKEDTTLRIGKTTLVVVFPAVADPGATRIAAQPEVDPAGTVIAQAADVEAAPAPTEAQAAAEPVAAAGPVAPEAAPPPPPPPPAPPPPPERAPVAAAAPAPVQPAQPFAPPSQRRRRGVASRLWVPAALTFAVILATAAGLLLYFATR